MSQQPPYGEPQDPQGQPYPQNPQGPQAPQGQPSYPSYPGPTHSPYGGSPYNSSPYGQQPKNNTTRNVLLVIGVVVLMLCGGVVAGVFALVGSAKDAIDEFNDDYRGSGDRPITVSEGEAFSIRGFDYAAGWSVGKDQYDSATIETLRATNERDDEDTERVNLIFKFLADGEILAQVNCSSNADIGFEEAAVLRCTSSADVPKGYDTVKVSDSALFE